MRKANKILMATVAILLCLVLITTSVASGIFAKFVITKSGSTTLKLTQFGVTVSMTPATDKLIALGAKSESLTESLVGVEYRTTISGLCLAPGDDLTDAVKFEISGTPSVKVKVFITTTVKFYDKDGNETTGSIYTVPANKIKNAKGEYISTAQSYMPIGFTFGDATATLTANGEVTANYSCSPWSIYTTSSTLQTAVAKGIADKITAAPNATKPSSSNIVEHNASVVTVAEFDKKEIKFQFNNVATDRKYFYMGFCYPLEHGSTDSEIFLYDKVSQYISKNINDNISMTVSYSVRIEQV